MNECATADALRSAALAKGEEALATMRHTATTSPALRAVLLLLLGRCRRFAFEAWIARRAPDEAVDEAALGPAVAALSGALEVSHARGGHDHILMRDVALELVLVYGKRHVAASNARHLQLATHYLSLAALLAQQHHSLFVDTATLCKSELAAAAGGGFSVGDMEDMGLSNAAAVTSSHAARYLLALRREADAPGGLADEFAAAKRNTAIRVHTILHEHFDAYRETCCVPQTALRLETGIVPAVPEALVCVQWVAAELVDEHKISETDGADQRRLFILLAPLCLEA